MRKVTLVVSASALVLALTLYSTLSLAREQQTAAPASAVQQPAPTPAAPSAAAPQEMPRHVTAYTLSPDRYEKARNLSKIRFRFAIISFVYGVIVLWLVLNWKLAPKYRTWAENASSKRFVQALVFSPLLILTLDILDLPLGIYDNWVNREYGLSVQGWRSWVWDWTKGEFISVILSIILIWILYAVIRKSPRKWWFYFWLASLPILLILFFLQPLIIDPMFHTFVPLSQKDPELVASLEKMVQRAGESIPPKRMFWMGAAEKSTAVNAYVTGFGTSKRVVIWDTTIAKMTTPQIAGVRPTLRDRPRNGALRPLSHTEAARLQRCRSPAFLVSRLSVHRLGGGASGGEMGNSRARRLGIAPNSNAAPQHFRVPCEPGVQCLQQTLRASS